MFRTLAAMAVFTVLLASSAHAQVPAPPGAAPAPGQSPGTGDLPPIPPPPGAVTPGTPPQTPPGAGDIPPPPPPAGRPSNPQNPDPSVTNYPPQPWYQDMYAQIYYSTYYYQQVEYSAYNQYSHTGYKEDYEFYVYCAYMRYVMTEYYWSFYDQYHNPKSYSWGYPTRGDLNYYYYYWVKPMYQQFYQYAAKYYSRHHNWTAFDYYDSNHAKHNYMYESARYYHRFGKCNYGRNGLDAGAKDDTAAFTSENAAGISISEDDVLAND